MTRPVALSIAGSDSGGGAGVQADLRTFCALGCHGTTAVTALTAQNLAGVRSVMAVPADQVDSQVRAVVEGFDVGAAKTGMLWSADTVTRVAELAALLPPLVVDPVMTATSGERLLQADAVRAYRELFPHAALATPNLDEAAILLGAEAISPENLEQAARTLADELSCPVLLKGGHLAGEPVDLLCCDGRLTRWQHPRIAGIDTHGGGCILSAAITAWLARGAGVVEACERGREFLLQAFTRAHDLAGGTRVAGIEAAV